MCSTQETEEQQQRQERQHQQDDLAALKQAEIDALKAQLMERDQEVGLHALHGASCAMPLNEGLLKCLSSRSRNLQLVLLQAKIAKALLDQRNQIHVEEKARQHELDLERVRGQNQLQMALALSAKASIHARQLSFALAL